MELTITETGALYLAHHKNSKSLALPSQRMKAAEDPPIPPLAGTLLRVFVPRYHPDNGR
jgi:hypothetical protein